MAQQTRKDPRAKVLSMTVRYKSATLDEFIEHHSHDVSCGGMFIKTPQPFPPGTLLKFEVRIAGDRKVMQGVGRVVWKREVQLADAERPAGMGVKFIKLDEESRHVIDQLVSSRKGDTSAYESEGEGTGVDAEATVGLGTDPIAPASKPPGESFFPKGEPAELPPPEDRTVMKQAAELLEEALREVGTDTAPTAAKEPPLAPAGDAEERENTRPGRPSRSGESSMGRLSKPSPPNRARMTSSGDRLGRSTSMNAPSATERAAAAREFTEKAREAVESKPAGPRPFITANGQPLANSLSSPKISIKSAPVAVSAAPARTVASSDGKGRIWFWVAAVVLCAGGTWWLWRPRTAAPPVSSVQEQSAASPTAARADQPDAPQAAQPMAGVETAPSPAASAEGAPPAASAATAASAQPQAAAPLNAGASAPPAVSGVSSGTLDAAKTPVKAPARPKAKPVAPPAGEEAPSAPAETPPAVTPPSAPVAAPPAEKPVESPPAAPPTAEAPKVVQPQAPVPAPVKRAAPAPDSDNPY